jgi:hypothetical protein
MIRDDQCRGSRLQIAERGGSRLARGRLRDRPTAMRATTADPLLATWRCQNQLDRGSCFLVGEVLGPNADDNAQVSCESPTRA